MTDWRELAPDEDPFPEAPWPESPNGKPIDRLGEQGTDAIDARILRGGTILDEPAMPPAVWGQGEDILWAEGESVIIAGPDGVGKTTLAGCLVRARLGIGDGEVLGHPVSPGKRRVLLLLMDRPRQARRALRRLFTTTDRGMLDDALRIWQGPPPADLARYPKMLADLAVLADADTVVIDSLKDAALKLSDDETGSGWNRARQHVIQGGAELIELHHPRKAQADNRKPSKLEDLYGSRWITAGAGSVISLWGEAGDLIVEFTHLKAPASQAGPWMVRLDPGDGTVHLDRPAVDLVEQIRYRPDGLTAEGAARLLSGSESPTRSEIEKARYRLNQKVAAGVLYRRDGTRGGRLGGEPAAWFLAAHDPDNDQKPDAPERSENRSETDQTSTGPERSENGGDTSPPFPDRYPAGPEPGQ
jgi:replicative DNA helicase